MVNFTNLNLLSFVFGKKLHYSKFMLQNYEMNECRNKKINNIFC